MKKVSNSAVEIFDEDFPSELTRAFAAGIKDCYSQTSEVMAQRFHNKNVRANTRPYYRRGLIEEMLLLASERYNNSVRDITRRVTVSEVNTGFWWHVELRIGRILLTQQASDEEKSLRHARYKQLYAQSSQQLLFKDSHDYIGQPKDNFLFATILHRSERGKPSMPEFIQILFPRTDKAGNLDGYHPGHIDFMIRFEELFKDPALEEVVPDEAEPVLLTTQNAP